MKITKAIIPVAGKGTRFLPATKQVPKEMLPILNIPMIHYVVKEAVEAGIEQIVLVSSSGKESIENYFDRHLELEEFLKRAGKEKEFELIKEIGEMVDLIVVRQREQLGLGHAVLCGEKAIGENENFAVLLGDDIILSDNPVTKQLIDISAAHDNSPVIGVMEVPNADTLKYGIVAGNFVDGDNKTLKMSEMVEKPDPENAPTNLATPGRYVLPAKIFQVLKEIPRGAGGEYQLTDAINELAKQESVYAHIFNGDRFDTGNVKGHFEATVEFALRDPSLRDHAISVLKEKLENYS